MAKEILIQNPTGRNLYTLIFNSVGQVWNGSAFVTLANSITSYVIALTESALLTEYTADFPSTIAAGRYQVEIRRLIGALPASTNAVTTDPVVGLGDIYWSGTAVVFQSGDTFARIGVAGAGLSAIPGLITFPTATVTGTPTTTSVNVTGLADTTANAYKDAYCLFLTGANAFAVAFPVLTSSYTTGTTTLTFTGLLAAPAVSDQLCIIGSKKTS